MDKLLVNAKGPKTIALHEAVEVGLATMSGTIFDHLSVVYLLSKAGYKINHEVEANGWEILNPVCRHVSSALKH